MVVVMEGHGRYRVRRGDRRRRGRRGVRQGRALPRSRLSGRAGDRPRSSAEGDAAAIAFPRADARRGLDFSFSGLKTAVVNHVRRHPDVAGRRRRGVVPGGGGRPAGREAARRRRRDRRAARSCSAAGSRRTPGCGTRVAEVAEATGRRAFLPPPGALHRQRGDDRGDGLVAVPGRRPDLARRRGRSQPPLCRTS